MTTVTKARIVRIGNSRGIRIPKPLLDQTGLGDEVELASDEGCIVIRPARRARADWDQAFQAMARRGDDGLLDGDDPVAGAWDEHEWQW